MAVLCDKSQELCTHVVLYMKELLCETRCGAGRELYWKLQKRLHSRFYLPQTIEPSNKRFPLEAQRRELAQPFRHVLWTQGGRMRRAWYRWGWHGMALARMSVHRGRPVARRRLRELDRPRDQRVGVFMR